MSRKPRQASQTGIYHWITRGIHKKTIFHGHEDFVCFFDLVKDLKAQHGIRLHHYCLMDNHVHMLLGSDSLEALSAFSHMLTRKYVYRYCRKYKWIGSLFQGRYRAIPVDDERYLLECGRYIERNPIKAGRVKNPEAYAHSSFSHYLGATNAIIDPSPAYLALDDREEVRRRIYELYVKADRLETKAEHKKLMLV